ncbi:mitogen-activated protein kinase kinase kinase 5-like [Mangifera indica]|uniref:mitogen-activated protein kinase kinase kinase 5-like n=1 Tax=Mangifera indica TaxID=29780 RepID=UPI001CF94DC6|nr:mitogen-activated protein kinase kinase kinase 5-like [Mangifera indica]
MRWLRNISFSSHTSSSSTLSDQHSPYNLRNKGHKNPHIRINSGTNNNGDTKTSDKSATHGNDNERPLRVRRLTRQKKLRHLSDEEMVEIDKLAQTDVIRHSVTLSRSDSNYGQLSNASTVRSLPYSSSAQPLPLPLPLPVRDDNGESRLLSPREAGGNGRSTEERERNGFRDTYRDRSDGATIKSVFSRGVEKKKPAYLETMSTWKSQQDLNRLDCSRENFRLYSTVKSASSSAFSSPILSPQNMDMNQMFHFYYNVPLPHGNKVWSAPEMPRVDFLGLPPPAFFDYTAFSADNSPFQSPRSRSPCRHPVSPTGPSSPLQSKLSSETSTHIEVHRLPLPPGPPISSPTTSVSHIPAKPEPLPKNNQWKKGKLIGRGTFGSVYVASNRETGALCAMKEVEIFPDDPKSAECIKQLEQEIKVLSHLKHPNIVQYYGSEIVEEKFYIYLEYVHPGSVNKYVREHCGAITESVVRNFTRHILYGLAYLHSKKTIHRDIKGANLLVDALGVVKLADFGMAKLLTGQAADLSLKGSPYWMAPELMMSVMQKDNDSDFAFAVDIWSLGCTIIEMFTGRPPWNEFEGAAAMFKVLKDTPAIPENLSAEGKDFLRCCFQRNPAKRPTASMLLEHRFLKCSQQPDVASCSHSFTGMKLTDKPQSLGEYCDGKTYQCPLYLSSQSPKNLSSVSDLLLKLPT